MQKLFPFIFLLLFLFVSLFSATFFNWNLPALTIILAALVLSFHQAILLAFFTGLVDDLIWVRSLGTSSLVFLGIVGVLEIYSRKYDRFHPIFLLIFSFSVLVVSAYLQTGRPSFFVNFLLAVLVTLARHLWQALREGDQAAIKLTRNRN